MHKSHGQAASNGRRTRSAAICFTITITNTIAATTAASHGRRCAGVGGYLRCAGVDCCVAGTAVSTTCLHYSATTIVAVFVDTIRGRGS